MTRETWVCPNRIYRSWLCHVYMVLKYLFSRMILSGPAIQHAVQLRPLPRWTNIHWFHSIFYYLKPLRNTWWKSYNWAISFFKKNIAVSIIVPLQRMYRKAACMVTGHISKTRAKNLYYRSPGSERSFSGMSVSGLSATQIEVRESVQKVCQLFPDEYWTEKDRWEWT